MANNTLAVIFIDDHETGQRECHFFERATSIDRPDLFHVAASKEDGEHYADAVIDLFS